MLFALKLSLVPLLIAGVTLGTRRWGPRIGGWLTALPVIAGPTLCFYAIEQGTDFAQGRADRNHSGSAAMWYDLGWS